MLTYVMHVTRYSQTHSPLPVSRLKSVYNCTPLASIKPDLAPGRQFTNLKNLSSLSLLKPLKSWTPREDEAKAVQGSGGVRAPELALIWGAIREGEVEGPWEELILALDTSPTVPGLNMPPWI